MLIFSAARRMLSFLEREDPRSAVEDDLTLRSYCYIVFEKKHVWS